MRIWPWSLSLRGKIDGSLAGVCCSRTHFNLQCLTDFYTMRTLLLFVVAPCSVAFKKGSLALYAAVCAIKIVYIFLDFISFRDILNVIFCWVTFFTLSNIVHTDYLQNPTFDCGIWSVNGRRDHRTLDCVQSIVYLFIAVTVSVCWSADWATCLTLNDG